MNTALDIITDKLLLVGMEQTEIDHLLARFLQEEAFDYVKYICESLSEDGPEEGKIPFYS